MGWSCSTLLIAHWPPTAGAHYTFLQLLQKSNIKYPLTFFLATLRHSRQWGVVIVWFGPLTNASSLKINSPWSMSRAATITLPTFHGTRSKILNSFFSTFLPRACTSQWSARAPRGPRGGGAAGGFQNNTSPLMKTAFNLRFSTNWYYPKNYYPQKWKYQSRGTFVIMIEKRSGGDLAVEVACLGSLPSAQPAARNLCYGIFTI